MRNRFETLFGEIFRGPGRTSTGMPLFAVVAVSETPGVG